MNDPYKTMVTRLKEAGLMGVCRKVGGVDAVIAFRKYLYFENGITGFDGYVAIYRKNDSWINDIGVDGDSFNDFEEAAESAINILLMTDDQRSELHKSYVKRIQDQV